MATFRICGVQMPVLPTKKDNLPRILEYIKACDCDFILFPEMALTGYNNDFSDTRTAEAWKQIAAACRQSYVTAIVGTGARQNGHTYIQSRVFGDDGSMLGTYEKIVPTEKDRIWCWPGEQLRVFTHKGLTFGCLICNDLWVTPGCGPYPDPRLSYQLGQKGAELIFHSANSGADSFYAQYHEANLRLRAKESGCYIVTVNALPSHGAVNSPSGVVSPDGEWLVKCPANVEQKFCCDLDIEID